MGGDILEEYTEEKSKSGSRIATEEKLAEVNPENRRLENYFLNYLMSTGKKSHTVSTYKFNLHMFWIWNLEHNGNKPFNKIKMKDIVSFQNYAADVWGWSPQSINAARTVLVALGKYIENALIDEYVGYKQSVSRVKPLKVPQKEERTYEGVEYKEDELGELLDYLVNNEMYEEACALALGMNNGRDAAELAQFKLRYFQPNYLVCGDALYKTPEPIKTIERRGKSKKIYVYTLAAPFKPYLDLWVMERRRLGIVNQWLFPRERDGIFYDKPATEDVFSSWADIFQKYTMERFDKPFMWNLLKRFFTTKLSVSGIPANVIQGLQGWDSEDMVNANDDSEIDRLEKYFSMDGIIQKQSTSLEIL